MAEMLSGQVKSKFGEHFLTTFMCVWESPGQVVRSPAIAGRAEVESGQLAPVADASEPQGPEPRKHGLGE